MHHPPFHPALSIKLKKDLPPVNLASSLLWGPRVSSQWSNPVTALKESTVDNGARGTASLTDNNTPATLANCLAVMTGFAKHS